MLAKSDVVASDGTFNIRPKPKKKWRQVYSLHSYVNGTFVPTVVAYMTSKSAQAYTQMFTSLKEWIHDNVKNEEGEPIEWEPKYWMTDFESGVFPAVHSVWPHTVQKGCYFHYTKSIWAKVQEKGLAKAYNKDVAVNETVRLVKVLPLVPTEAVASCVQYVITKINTDPALATDREKLKSFMEDYFLPTWVGTAMRRPTFELAKWSHNDRSVLRPDGTPWIDHPKCTNALESWHRTRNSDARKHGTSFWTILSDIQEEIGRGSGFLTIVNPRFRHSGGAEIP